MSASKAKRKATIAWRKRQGNGKKCSERKCCTLSVSRAKRRLSSRTRRLAPRFSRHRQATIRVHRQSLKRSGKRSFSFCESAGTHPTALQAMSNWTICPHLAAHLTCRFYSKVSMPQWCLKTQAYLMTQSSLVTCLWPRTHSASSTPPRAHNPSCTMVLVFWRIS